MADITEKDIEHLAELARLELSDKQKKQIQKNLPAILDFVGELEEVDVSSAEVGRQLLGLENVFRRDEEHGEPKEKEEHLIEQAPQKHESFIEVPEVFGDNKSNDH